MKYNLLFIFFSLLALQVSAQTVPSPQQTDQIITDPNGNSKADPGDKIRYKVTIQNTHPTNPATGTTLNVVPDPKTTFTLMSFRSSPLAINDSYTATGNIQIVVPAASGVKANDFDDALAGTTLSCGTCMSANGGTVALNNDGSFTYTPPAGYNGTDNFTYTITDGNPVAGVPTTDVATVSIAVSNMVWFINNTGGGSGGTGTLNSPFKTLADFNTAAGTAAGHTVHIQHTGTDYTGNIVLKNDMRLFGTGHTGGTTLADVLPFTLAPNSPALPAINGTRPVITNTGGNGVNLAQNNTLRGFTVGSTSGTKIVGSGFGTLTASDLSLLGNGAALSLTNGTASVTISSFASTSSATAVNLNNVNGTIDLQGGMGLGISGATTSAIVITGGDVDLVYNPGITHAGSGPMISVSGGHNGTLAFQSFGLTATAGTGLQFDNADGTYNINTTTTLSGGAAVSISNGSSGTFNFINNANNINNPGSTAFSILNSNATVAYNGTISKSSAGFLIDIDNHDANTVTFQGPGSLLSSTGSSSGIRVQNSNGGTIDFASEVKTLTTGANKAVTLSSNTGGTINFTNGGLAITTTSGIGFDATGGGTISVQGIGNTIASSAATALNVQNTTIGAANLNFRQISAAGTANGIVLNTTGSSGGLTVTGTGTTNGSGGTISNITERGVSVTSSSNLSLKNMTFTNANTTDGSAPCGASDNSGCNAAIYLNTVTNAILDNVDIGATAQHGINLREVSGFQLLNSTLINNGSEVEEANLYAQNIFGTCAITSSSLTIPAERAAVIYNTSKTLTLTVTSSTFGLNQTQMFGADALEINNLGAGGNLTLDIVNSTFTQPKTNGLQVITESTSGTSFSSIDITGSTFDPGTGLGAAIDLATNAGGDMDFNIVNNPLIKSRGINAVNIFAFPGSKFEGRVNTNTINVGDGTGSGSGVNVNLQGNQNSQIEIKDNNITGAIDFGITLNANLGSGRLDGIVTGNTVSVNAMGGYTIHAAAGSSGSMTTNKICAHVANNNTTAPMGAFGNFQARAVSATGPHMMLLQGGGTTVATNWNANGNTPMHPTATISQSGFGSFMFSQTCTIPANPAP